MDTVFDLFEEVPYEFLKITRGTVYGNRISEAYSATGVFKRRNDMIQSGNQELRQSASTLHIHPDEAFIADITVNGKLLFVGNGIRINSVNYEITGDTGGFNYDTNELEHYTLTLQTADFTEEGS